MLLLLGEQSEQGRIDLAIGAPEPRHDLGPGFHLGVVVLAANGRQRDRQQLAVGGRWLLISVSRPGISGCAWGLSRRLLRRPAVAEPAQRVGQVVQGADGGAAALEALPLRHALAFVEVAASLGPIHPVAQQPSRDAVQRHADPQPAVVVLTGRNVLQQLLSPGHVGIRSWLVFSCRRFRRGLEHRPQQPVRCVSHLQISRGSAINPAVTLGVRVRPSDHGLVPGATQLEHDPARIVVPDPPAAQVGPQLSRHPEGHLAAVDHTAAPGHGGRQV